MKTIYELYSKKELCVGLTGFIVATLVVGYLALLWQYSITQDEEKAETRAHLGEIYNNIADVSEVTASLQTLYRGLH